MTAAKLIVEVVGTLAPRIVALRYPDILWRVPVASKTAYLTFDDGPSAGFTEDLLEVLARYDAKASFFLIGTRAERFPRYVKELLEAGHTIGNHSFSHPDGWRVAGSTMRRELDRTTEVLEDLSGRRISWMRPPYGHFTREMRKWCRDRGQRLTMWDVGPGDYIEWITPSDVERHVVRHVRPGSIIVLHDNPRRAPNTPAAVDLMLRTLVPQGWRFAALTESA